MARPKRTAIDVPFPQPVPAMASESMVSQPGVGRKDQTKGMLALHIDVRARNWLNVVTGLEGINQSDLIERLIFKEMQTYDITAALAKLMRQ